MFASTLKSGSEFFRNKVAVVTGGGSGLGKALCLNLAQRKAICVVTDINYDAAAQVAEEIKTSGGYSRALQVDVTEPESVARAIKQTLEHHERLDYMFNNAGIITLAEVRDMNLEHWHKIINVNLLGVLYGTTAAYTEMVKQRSGHIVNIASIGGLITMPTYTAYATTKHAVVGLSNSLRAEAAGLGVKVTVVCPGIMNTGLGDAATIVNAKRENVHKSAASNYAMDPDVAARLILRGVQRNPGSIVFPFSSRLIWWLYRLWPKLLAPMETRMVAKFREARERS